MSDLPVPPGITLSSGVFLYSLHYIITVSHVSVALLGCPPLQGSEGGQQNFLGVLETAMKIANQDADGEDEEEDGQSVAAKVKKKKELNKSTARL